MFLPNMLHNNQNLKSAEELEEEDREAQAAVSSDVDWLNTSD